MTGELTGHPIPAEAFLTAVSHAGISDTLLENVRVRATTRA